MVSVMSGATLSHLLLTEPQEERDLVHSDEYDIITFSVCEEKSGEDPPLSPLPAWVTALGSVFRRKTWTWAKKSDSYGSQPSPPLVVADSGGKSFSLDSHGYVNPLQEEPLVLAVAASPCAPPQDVGGSPPPPPPPTEGPTRGGGPLSPTGQQASSPTEKRPLSRTLTQPTNTVEYVVSTSDTLAGIAARFDTTPSELVKLNRLVSRLIFPGQTLYVPVKSAEGESQNGGEQEAPLRSPTDKEGMEGGSLSPKPGHAERVQSPTRRSLLSSTGGSSTEDQQLQVTDLVSPHALLDPSLHPPPVQAPLKEVDMDARCPERFLKINSKHITDGQGFVSGVLLVTPNTLMFDPNVSDTLVIEHGVETYGVIAPMDMIARAAIYFDIAHMRVKNAPESLLENTKPKIYMGPSSTSSAAYSADLIQDTYTPVTEFPTAHPIAEVPDLISFNEQPLNQNSSNQTSSVAQQSTVEANTDDNQEPPPPVAGSQEGTEAEDTAVSPPAGLSQSESDVSLMQLDSEELASDKLARSATVREGSRNTQSRRERMLKRLSYPVESLSSYTQSVTKIISSTPRNIVDFSSGLFVRSSLEEDKNKDGDGGRADIQPTVGYKNMVEDKPDLFAEVDIESFIVRSYSTEVVGRKINAKDELLPRPARQYEGQPLYLCLRMGQPQNRKGHWSTPFVSYSKRRMKKEYWFSIPRARVDDLYMFFHHWCSDVYGDVDEMSLEARGFLPIESDIEEETESEASESIPEVQTADFVDANGKTRNRGPLSFLKLVEGHFGSDGSSSPFPDWELVSLSEAQKSPEIDLPLPDLSDKSEILTEDHRRELCKNLPARAEGYPWTLIYSSSKHGFSLKTMYREMAKFETPVLLAISDTLGTVFGAVISCSLKMSDHFYGTGESFLFTFHPEYKCYHWTGENMYFIKGDSDSLAIGAGDGNFGIWLDGDLYHGRSHRCLTFGNESLSAQEDFVVKALEAWGFV